MRKFLLFLAMAIGLATAANAQVTKTATASGTIVTPISLTKTMDMNFGNMAVSSTGGTVILTPAGTRTPTGGVTLPSVTGTVSAASFTVSGASGYTYVITLPQTATTVTYNTSNHMTVDTWTSSPTPTGTLDGSGNQTLTIGATINVAALQAAGLYVSPIPFEVTVNYN